MATVEINGSSFEVAHAGEALITLRGTRGGHHTLVRNVHSGRWIFLRNGIREERIRSVAGLDIVGRA